ncbi:MAG: hypothetical protein R3253_00715 [Longimicrobiales bacterium]|nr:hypothetical protein [Longimicrobiales bacterium]
MPLRRTVALICASALGGCYSPPDAPPATRTGAMEGTELVLQVVDAGTGSILRDEEMTVRYLVREPIVFDVASVDRVSTSEPYQISHQVAHPNLVVEVRLEADSYHRLDTVLAVPKGATAGPLTMRMSPRLDRVAETPPVDPEPAPSQPATTPETAGRTAMRAGDLAFNRREWLEASEAYQRMPAPSDDMSEYGRDYLEAKIRQGVAHINRSEFGRALEIFEEVTDMEQPGPTAYLRLAQTQCAVGRVEEGRGTLALVDRARNRLGAVEQSTVAALIAYQRGVCSHGEFDRAQTTRERVRTGAQAIQELNAFIEGARRMSPVPQEIVNAVEDAEQRVEDIRRRAGGGG